MTLVNLPLMINSNQLLTMAKIDPFLQPLITKQGQVRIEHIAEFQHSILDIYQHTFLKQNTTSSWINC